MHTKGGHTKGATMYRHIHTHGRHASPIYKEIPKEFDSRYKTRPFNQLRFRLVDTVDGSSIRSKEAAPTSPQNQVERPSSARVEPQVISVGSSGSGSDCHQENGTARDFSLKCSLAPTSHRAKYE